jgi:uncharacterized protein (TIGR00661 family)
MKILYGVQGTGNGHISRARKMAGHLCARGAEVTWLFSGRPVDRLFDMEGFGDFQHRAGLTMAQCEGRVMYWRTLRETQALQFIRDVRALDVEGYDAVITDFEPVTAWAARLAGKTCIGIGHQYAFGRPIPRRGENLASQLVMRHYAPADIGVGLHWHHFDTDILPPIIDTRLASRAGSRSPLLVYLPFEEQSRVTALLQRFPQCHFLQYSPDLDDGTAGNVELRKTCLQGFRDDLCRSRAVICNAGFELVSECLHMGIPMLVKPVAGQMEQLSNALALQQLGWGSATDRLDEATLGDWLQRKRETPNIRYPDVAAALADWVLAGEWHDQRALWEMLWSCTRNRSAGGSQPG